MAGFYGTTGNDTFFGTEEDDLLRGFAGDDTLHGNGGNDMLFGDEGNDLLYGGAGNDYFKGGTGVDYFDGGDDLGGQLVSGTPGVLGDRISFYEFTATEGVIADLRTGIISNDGFGNVESFVGIESLSGGTAFADQLYGSDGANWLTGGPGDTIMAFGGNDYFQLEGALAILDGGTGIDTINVFTSGALRPDSNGDGRAEQVEATSGVVVDLLAGTMSDEWGSGTIAGIENVGGSYLNDTLRGDSNANILAGYGGDDNLAGEGGNDTIHAASGSDIVSGGDGIDTVSYSGFDVANDGQIHYDYNLGHNSTTSAGGVIVDLATGVAMETSRPVETNQLGEYVPPSGTASQTDTIVATDQLSGIENITGSGLGDRLSGDDNANIIAPGAGDDIVDGRGGIDTIDYTSARGALNVDLAQGVATQAGSGAAPYTYYVATNDPQYPSGQMPVTVHADDAEASTDTLASIENVYGSALNDTIVGDAQDNILEGRGGDDIIDGGDGHDVLRGGLGADRLTGGLGDDFLSEGIETSGPYSDDVYDGGAGNDRVTLFNYVGDTTVDLRIEGVAQNTGATGNDTFIGIEHVTGGWGNNRLIGNEVGNWFWTFSGTDNLSGNGGDDLFTVGFGDKIIDGGVGADSVDIRDTAFQPLYTADGITVSLQLQGTAQATGVGNWTLTSVENLGGSWGADELTGDANANTLVGANGDDTLRGGAGNDILAGDGYFGLDGAQSGAIRLFDDLGEVGGNDFLDGGAGADTMMGGAGNDTYVVDDAGDVVTELADRGSDRILVGFSYALGANVEHLTLTGTAAISGAGNDLNNSIVGNSANNGLNGMGGADYMFGNGGDDTYYVDSAGDRAIEGSGAGNDRVVSTVSFVLGANVEHLTLTGTAAINGTGNAMNNSITGNSAANVLNGAGGADYMFGNGGDDTYYVENVGDRAIEGSGAGNDRVVSTVSFVLGANIEHLTLAGTAAINGAGNALANSITGNSANNVLNGAGGADYMFGNGGDDTYYVDNAGDRAIEGAGAGLDRVVSTVSFALGANVEYLTLAGTAAISGAGNNLDNSIVGNSANNGLNGMGGADYMFGNGGDDTYYVDNAGDRAIEGAGAGLDRVVSTVSFVLGANVEYLTLTGTAAINGTGNGLANSIVGNSANNVLSGAGGGDYMFGNGGDDTLDGGSGSDRIDGGDGFDTISGGAGNDILIGGAGNDMFRFDSALDPFVNVDGITDFSVSDDTIQLSRSVFSAFTADGVLDASAFRVGTNAQDADDRIIYDSATGRIYYDSDGLGGAAQILFTTVLAGTALTSADFLIVG